MFLLIPEILKDCQKTFLQYIMVSWDKKKKEKEWEKKEVFHKIVSVNHNLKCTHVKIHSIDF